MVSEADLVIKTSKLTKYYGKARGIIDVDLSVQKGEVFGFLGPNGAGKSTTIRTILDLIRPTSGMALVNGMDPTKEGAKVRRSVGYLPSDFGMYKTLTAEKYLGTLLAMMGHTGPDRIGELADQFQMDLNKRIKDFSRGNRQKVGLVSAFMHYPKLVILDEPTTGLDPLMQQEFYKLVLEEKKAGRTVFLSSHILAEVDAICDRVAIIREGEIIVTEKMSNFKRKTGKIMVVTFAKPVSPEEFRKLPGITEVHLKNGMRDTLEMTVASNVDKLIKTLATYEITDLDYKETSLEHLFLHFYGVREVRNMESANGGGVKV
ncbi:MAG: ABC transporter ATP-binding protein [Thermoplasmatota archaeon]